MRRLTRTFTLIACLSVLTGSCCFTTMVGTAGALNPPAPIRPDSLAVGPNRNLYIADDARNQILERLPDGRFSVFAGTGKAGYSGNHGRAGSADLDDPSGMAFASDGTLYFADQRNHRVRAISSSGIMTTVVGSGRSGRRGPIATGTPALEADVTPYDVALSPDGQLYVATGQQVLRLESNHTLTPVLGAGTKYQGPGAVDGVADASADDFTDLAFDAAGDLYVFGFDSKSILMITPAGRLSEPMGYQTVYPHGDGGLAPTPAGSVLAMGELSVVRLSPAGGTTIVTFFPGTFDGIRGFSPNGIAVGPDGTIYVDTYLGNGFTNRSAIASIGANGASSSILWESS